jgi:hypothetical protein
MLLNLNKDEFVQKYSIKYNESWKKTLIYKLFKLFNINKKPSIKWLIQHKRILNRQYKLNNKYSDLSNKLI